MLKAAYATLKNIFQSTETEDSEENSELNTLVHNTEGWLYTAQIVRDMPGKLRSGAKHKAAGVQVSTKLIN